MNLVEALALADHYDGANDFGDERDEMSDALRVLAAEVGSIGAAAHGVALSGDLVSPSPSFVHLGGDVWVNPAHVVSVHPSDAGCLIGVPSGHAIESSKAVLEVLALLTDESETP